MKLRDCCELVPGFAFKSKDFGVGFTKVIKIKDIQPPFVNLNNSDTIDISKHDKEKLQKYYVKKGDFVIAMTGATIGKVGMITEGDGYINQRVLVFRPKGQVSKEFLYYVLFGKAFVKHIINSIDSNSAQPNISADSIGDFEIELPRLHQQKIAGEILSNIDAQIVRNNDMVHKLRLNDTTTSCFSMKGEMRHVA